MENSFSGISGIIATVFLFGIIVAGVFLYKKGLYHIFYFSLCGLFLVNLMALIISVTSQVSSLMDGPQYIGQTDAGPMQKSSVFAGFEFLQFLSITGWGLFFLTSLLSLINPFIPKNKLAVKIVSGVMLFVIALLVVIGNAISHIGKIGG